MTEKTELTLAEPMNQIRFFLFGSPRIERDGITVEVGLRKTLALGVYLVMTRRSHSRAVLAALFWPDDDQSTARANLRRVVYRLRKLLGEDVLKLDLDVVGLEPSANIWTDVETYSRYVDP